MTEHELFGIEGTKVIDLQGSMGMIKSEAMEKSGNEGTLKDFGRLSGDTSPGHWTGGVTLLDRLDNNEITADEVNGAQEDLGLFYVDTTEGAPKRCVDGRRRKGYKAGDSEGYLMPLGPQVQGGTNGDAIATRYKNGYVDGATFVQDVADKAKETDAKSRFSPGDHKDDHATGEATGCGQLDGQERKIDLILDDKRRQTLLDSTKSVISAIGLDIPDEAIDLALEEVLETAKDIDENREEFFKDKHKALDEINQINSDGVEMLTEGHNEAFFVINLVPNTTLHTSEFAAHTGGQIEAFGLDAWNILEDQGDAALATVIEAVATGMDLTDGSLRLLVRFPTN